MPLFGSVAKRSRDYDRDTKEALTEANWEAAREAHIEALTEKYAGTCFTGYDQKLDTADCPDIAQIEADRLAEKQRKDRERKAGRLSPAKPSNGYWGIYPSGDGTWIGKTKIGGTTCYGGSYLTKLEAARAVDGAVLHKFPDVADRRLNFPDDREATLAECLANPPSRQKRLAPAEREIARREYHRKYAEKKRALKPVPAPKLLPVIVPEITRRYMGLVRMRRRWKAQRRYRGQMRYAGIFLAARDAARAIDGRLLELFPDIADDQLNFPTEREKSKAFYAANKPNSRATG